MAKKKVTVKKYFKTKNSYITVIDNSLLVMNNFVPDKAFTAIKVCKGFYIELGRNIEEFNTVLLETRVPIMFELVTNINGFEHYKIVRMQTGKVDDITLGTLICKDNIITRLTCDKSYRNEEDYTRYEQVGSLWKIAVKYNNNQDDNMKNVSNAVINLLGINKEMNVNIKTTYSVNKVEVIVNGMGMNYTYTFILNEKSRMYELIMITLN